jgi:glycosyltransferase involved in cell wall biosynthesis
MVFGEIMRIAIYHSELFYKGGGERILLELVTRLKNHKWTIITPYLDLTGTFTEFKDANVEFMHLPKLGLPMKKGILGSLLLALKLMQTKLDLERFDLLIVSSSGITEAITFRNHSIPTIIYCHEVLSFRDLSRIGFHNLCPRPKYFMLLRRFLELARAKVALQYKFLERILWRNFDLILCNSEEVKGRIEKGRLTTEPVYVLHPGINVDKFKPTWTYEKYFFVPGRFSFLKRQELAIEAFKLFQTKRKDFKLILAGELAFDKLYFKKIRRLANASENVEILVSPSDSKLIELYQNCYAVLFTAVDEPWGIVPIEGLACGKPVISVNEGGPKESIVDGRNGFLVEPTPESFANRMLFLAERFDLVKTMGKIARKDSLEYDWSYFAEKFNKLILNVINS